MKNVGKQFRHSASSDSARSRFRPLDSARLLSPGRDAGTGQVIRNLKDHWQTPRLGATGSHQT
eukprot:3622129-Rhodomonas_salina.2